MRYGLACTTLSIFFLGNTAGAFADVPPVYTQYGSYLRSSQQNSGTYPQPVAPPYYSRTPSPAKVKKTDDSYYAKDRTLLTGTAVDIGAQFSRYIYHEPQAQPGMDVKIRGLKYGLTGSASMVLYDKWFGTAEGRLAYGDADYKGSGTHTGETDSISEIRLLAGRDILFNQFSISPFTGIGYRYLYNDGRGETSTGANGYRRESQYVYMPIGFRNRIKLDDISRVNWSFEYDQFIWGKQKSMLSDASSAYEDIQNFQHYGYGLRGDAMYERNAWAIGPFFNYWNINQSAQSDGWVEPHNDTLEFGLQLKYRLL